MCSSGTYGMIPDQPCAPCAPNFVSQEGYVLCTWCGDFETTGRAPNRAADECLCAPGWYINGTVGALAECAHCPPGTVQVSVREGLHTRRWASACVYVCGCAGVGERVC